VTIDRIETRRIRRAADAPAAERIRSDETRPHGLVPPISPRRDVTLVEGSSFCVSSDNGDIAPGGAGGLFVNDTRVLSRWELRVDGRPVDPLTAIPEEPYSCVFVGRAGIRPGHLEPTLIVERHRFVGRGMREDIVLRNFGAEPAGVDVTLLVDADFADLFQVKEHRVLAHLDAVRHQHVPGGLMYWSEHGAEARGVRVFATAATSSPNALSLRAVIPPKGTWSATVEALPSIQGLEFEADFPPDRPIEAAAPAVRMRGWRAAAPRIEVENVVLAEALGVSERDLGALRIADPEHPDDLVVAAGAPWFMTLFGRDSIITSWMMLPFAPELAMDTLRTLARLQGRSVNPMSEEQPGRILHEVRFGPDHLGALGGEHVYYGSIDATPLFVMLAGRALRWGVAEAELRALRPAVEAALDWIVHYGDADGDGFVEYRRSTDRGLANQGWKDSGDAVAFADGALARPPIALAEVQGHCYAAFLAGAELEAAWGEPARAAELRDRAERLRRAFHRAFWDERLGCYAMALDGRKRRVAVVASNVGHCLWTGIADESVADRIVDRLLAPEMFTGFGIRTLSAEAAAFNPASYHNGSVWPHDTVLAAAGMERYGRRDAALTVIEGLIDALEAFGGRLPELFCGFGRDDKQVPVPYPTSCSPQAWAAATPFELLRIALGLEADAPNRVFRALPAAAVVGDVHIDGLPLGELRLGIDADPEAVRIAGIPDGFARGEADDERVVGA